MIQSVQRIEQQIRERLPLGSRISERSLKDDLYRRVSIFINFLILF